MSKRRSGLTSQVSVLYIMQLLQNKRYFEDFYFKDYQINCWPSLFKMKNWLLDYFFFTGNIYVVSIFVKSGFQKIRMEADLEHALKER